MHIFRPFFLLGVFVVVCALPPCIKAQDSSPAAESDNAPAATASSNAGTGDLFPSGGVPARNGSASARSARGRRNGNAAGGRKRNGRRHDQLVTQADADPLAVRVAYRRAKTVALARDPGLADLLHRAAAADTDNEKRLYLKEYYVRLFASVQRIDSSPAMKAHVAVLSQVATQRYNPKRREVGGDEDLVNGRGRGRRGRAQ